MRSFVLYRKEDVTGASGPGFVAEGVEFFSKRVAMMWRTGRDSLVVWDSVQDMLAINGHGGKTLVLWNDEDWVKPNGEALQFYCEGLSNITTGALESHRSPDEAEKEGLLRPCEYLAKRLDPDIAERRYRARVSEALKMVTAGLHLEPGLLVTSK